MLTILVHATDILTSMESEVITLAIIKLARYQYKFRRILRAGHPTSAVAAERGVSRRPDLVLLGGAHRCSNENGMKIISFDTYSKERRDWSVALYK
jgi:hypothetical protein